MAVFSAKTLPSILLTTLLVGATGLLSGCGDKKKEPAPSAGKDPMAAVPQAMTAMTPPVAPGKVTAPMPKVSSAVVIPEAALGWAWLPGDRAGSFASGASIVPTQDAVFYVFLVSDDGTLTPVRYAPGVPTGATGITIDGKAFSPTTPLPQGKLKRIRFNASEAQALITLTRKAAAPFLARWPRLKKLGLGKISVVLKGDKATVVFRPRKKKVSADFRNALTYWHQLALSARTQIHAMGGQGPVVAKALLKADLALKPSRITYSITLNAKATGWVLHQLVRLYPVFTPGDAAATPPAKGPKMKKPHKAGMK